MRTVGAGVTNDSLSEACPSNSGNPPSIPQIRGVPATWFRLASCHDPVKSREHYGPRRDDGLPFRRPRSPVHLGSISAQLREGASLVLCRETEGLQPTIESSCEDLVSTGRKPSRGPCVQRSPSEKQRQFMAHELEGIGGGAGAEFAPTSVIPEQTAVCIGESKTLPVLVRKDLGMKSVKVSVAPGEMIDILAGTEIEPETLKNRPDALLGRIRGRTSTRG